MGEGLMELSVIIHLHSPSPPSISTLPSPSLSSPSLHLLSFPLFPPSSPLLPPSFLAPLLPPPLHHQASEQFYSSSGSEDESEEDSEGSEGSEGKKKKKKRKPLVMDPDHRLLLRSVKPLLQSRNASVSGVEVGQWGWGEGGAMVCSEVNVGGVTRV